jgi:hypothetical protein
MHIIAIVGLYIGILCLVKVVWQHENLIIDLYKITSKKTKTDREERSAAGD